MYVRTIGEIHFLEIYLTFPNIYCVRPYFSTNPTLKTHFLFSRSGILNGFLRSGFSHLKLAFSKLEVGFLIGASINNVDKRGEGGYRKNHVCPHGGREGLKTFLVT